MHGVLNILVFCLKLLFEKCYPSDFVYMQGKLYVSADKPSGERDYNTFHLSSQ